MLILILSLSEPFLTVEPNFFICCLRGKNPPEKEVSLEYRYKTKKYKKIVKERRLGRCPENN
jgi:hypothetical protein